MKFEEVNQIVKDVPYTSPEHGRLIYHHVLENGLTQCLELGFAHGKTTCYIAAALDELGGGHVIGVDLLDQKDKQIPSVETLLEQTGLGQYVTIVREKTTYNWYLKSKIEEQTQDGICQPCFDFCFIDGPKHWVNDGMAFFLADKLLNPNGWVLFDDYSWRYKDWEDVGWQDSIFNRSMSEDEISTAQIERVFQLLVMQHPDYSNFAVDHLKFAWAQKVKSDTKTVRYRESYSFQAYLNRIIRRITKLLPS